MKELGPGISTYHRLLLWLFCLFIILFILHLPVLLTFYSFDFYDGEPGSWVAGYTLGNMGFSKTECEISSMIKGNSENLKCRTGEIAQLVDWGVTTNIED